MATPGPWARRAKYVSASALIGSPWAWRLSHYAQLRIDKPRSSLGFPDTAVPRGGLPPDRGASNQAPSSNNQNRNLTDLSDIDPGPGDGFNPTATRKVPSSRTFEALKSHRKRAEHAREKNWTLWMDSNGLDSDSYNSRHRTGKELEHVVKLTLNSDPSFEANLQKFTVTEFPSNKQKRSPKLMRNGSSNVA